MNAIGQALSLEDSADVAANFASQPGGLPPPSGDRVPESGHKSEPVWNPAAGLWVVRPKAASFRGI